VVSAERELDHELLARTAAVVHDLRCSITLALCRRTASAAELADELGVPVEKVRYQLRQLAEAGIVEVAEHKARRGVREHFYLVEDDPMLFEDDDLSVLSARQRERMQTQLLKRSLGAAVEAMKAGNLSGREGSVIAHMPLRLDAEGWSELAEIYRKALDRTLRIRLESRLRLQETGEDPLIGSSSVFLFEVPPD
jgi:predicted DNA-binding transcriptional regulator YafY